jgi:hypothetical protein
MPNQPSGPQYPGSQYSWWLQPTQLVASLVPMSPCSGLSLQVASLVPRAEALSKYLQKQRWHLTLVLQVPAQLEKATVVPSAFAGQHGQARPALPLPRLML